MEFKHLVATPAIIAAGLLSSQAHAVDMAGAKLRGFMSAAGSYSGYEGVVDDVSKGLNFTRDTRLGLNIAANFADDWSFAGQLLGRGGAGNNWRVTADWLFATWRPTDNFSLRAGRQIFASWLYSDQIDVGYNYIWVRPPQEVYSMNPLKSFNGIGLAYNRSIGGGFDITGEVFGGYADFTSETATLSLDGAAKNLLGGSISVQNDFLQVRAFASTSQVVIGGTAQSSEAFAGIRDALAAVYTALSQPAVAAQIAAIPAGTTGFALAYPQERVAFYSLGTKFDWNNIIAIGEVARLVGNGTLLTRRDGAYGTVGYRIWRITPYVTYAWTGATIGLFTPTPYRSWTFGANYKVNDSAVLKLDYKRVTALDNPSAAHLSTSNTMLKDQTEGVVSASLDLVF